MLDPDLPRRVGEEQFECKDYEVSAYAFLESVVDADARLEEMALDARRHREMAYHATGKREAVRTSGGGRSKIADNTNKCIDIARDLDEEAEQLRERYALARRMIDDLPDAEGRRIVEMRHIRRMRWEDIARKRRYDQSQVRRKDSQALRGIEKQLVQMGIRR